uniref:7TM_GPCR_Srx domain-containing protein n=1 Tax=Steinernema glaseri TaxID=37863 RepID=A0A1I7ZS25_9BILA
MKNASAVNASAVNASAVNATRANVTVTIGTSKSFGDTVVSGYIVAGAISAAIVIAIAISVAYYFFNKKTKYPEWRRSYGFVSQTAVPAITFVCLAHLCTDFKNVFFDVFTVWDLFFKSLVVVTDFVALFYLAIKIRFFPFCRLLWNSWRTGNWKNHEKEEVVVPVQARDVRYVHGLTLQHYYDRQRVTEGLDDPIQCPLQAHSHRVCLKISLTGKRDDTGDIDGWQFIPPKLYFPKKFMEAQGHASNRPFHCVLEETANMLNGDMNKLSTRVESITISHPCLCGQPLMLIR